MSISFARTPVVCPFIMLPALNVPDDTLNTAFGGVATSTLSEVSVVVVPGTASNIPLILNISETPKLISSWSYAVP